LAIVFGACAEEPDPPSGLLTDYASGVDAEFGVETFALGPPSISVTYPPAKPFTGFDQQAGNTPLTPNGVELSVKNCDLKPGTCAIECRLNGVLKFKTYKLKGNQIANVGNAGLKTLTCYLLDESGGGSKEFKNTEARTVRSFYVRKPCKNGSDCASSDACAYEQCVDLKCFYSPKPFCCNDNWACLTGETCQNAGTASAKCSSCTQDADCSDGDECTTDKCDLSLSKGQCTNIKTNAKCCTKASDPCDDGLACTTDTCDTTKKECINKKIAGACCSNADCDPNDPCLVGQCVDAECRTGADIFKKDCCSPKHNPTCNDNRHCSLDKCDTTDAKYQKVTDGVKWTQCKHSPDPSKGDDCCDPFNQTNECDDGNACTYDACINFTCVNKVVAQCCLADKDCNDKNSCTTDTCAKEKDAKATDAGECVFKKADPLCCESTPDCDDGKQCTADKCNLFTNKCVFTKTDPSCCDLSSECNDNDLCTTDFCVNGFCVHGPDGQKPNCCTKSDNCNDNNPCTIDTCDTVKNDCKFVSNGDPTCCVGNDDCDDGDCATLDFCASNNKCAFKGDPTKCSNNIDCDDGLACTKDTCDTSSGCGVCKHEASKGCCDNDAQCNDGNPCSADKCLNNKCENSGLAGCCIDDKDALSKCDDKNGCTIDYCINNTCRHTVPKNGCCATDKDCEDGDFCTLNQCSDIDAGSKTGKCKFPKDPLKKDCTCDPTKVAQDVPNSHCNDNNTCTIDACIGGICIHKPKKGCCLDKFDCNDGNLCTFDQCVFNECLNYEATGDNALCCKKETEKIDCAYLNSSCAKGICETKTDGSRACVASPLDVCTVQIGYCQDFSGGTSLKAMGWNPGDVKGTAKTNWKVATKGNLGPDQHAMLDWTPTKTDYETCLQSPIIQAAGSKSITIQYDRLLDVVKEDTTFRIYGSLDGADVDWTKATLIDVITPKSDVGPNTVDLKLPPALTGSNGLRLAFCAAGKSTANLTSFGLDNVCVVKGGKPTFGKCPPNQIAKFNDLIALPLKAKDPDSDAILSFSLVNAPKFVTLSSALYFWLDNSWNTQLKILPKDINDVGTHTVTIKVSDGFLYSLCTFKVTVIANAGYLVWRPTEVPSTHGAKIANLLKGWVAKKGLTGEKAIVQHTTDLSLYSDLTKFAAIYISLGVYPKKHVLTETEALPLKLFLQQGGKLYFEGGDTWAFDTQTSLHGFFHIKSAKDDSNFGVEGPLKGNGVYQNAKQSPVKFYSFAYEQNFTYNNGNDLLNAATQVKETRNVLHNDGKNDKFFVQVAHDDPNGYRTVASSILVSGLTTDTGTDKPEDAIERIQAFFEEGFVDCVDAKACDDGDECTQDSCIDKRCEHKNTCECSGQETVKCGDTITITSNKGGKSDKVEIYNCAAGTKFSGNEYAVKFGTNTSRPVELNVTSLSDPSARVFVLNAGKGTTCDTNACFATGGAGKTKFASAKGNLYYIVLDTVEGKDATAKVTITCGAGEICNDLQDNNSNGLIDCKDLASCCGDPACAEICDGVDNDCDGHIDENCDADGDKFCDAKAVVEGTPAVCPKGKGDCDDSDTTVNPGAKEVCLNGKDDNCNGAQDEEDAAGCKNYFKDVDEDKFGAGAPKCLCAPKGTYTADKGGDCNDADPKINPVDNPEICHNGVDDDCTGTQNDLNALGCTTFYTDTDADGFGTLPKKCLCFAEGAATAKKPGDCNDGDTNINPNAKEICNGLDDDCDGLRDEGCDDDGDLYCDFDMKYVAVGAEKKQCAQAAQGANLNVTCSEKDAKITQISFASYGQPKGKCGGFEQSACHAKLSVQKLKDACLGKHSCIIAATDQVFGKPCEGQKSLQVEVVCTGKNGKPPSKCPKGPGDTDDNDPKINPEGIEICDGKDNDSDFQIDEDCDDDGDQYCDKDMIVIGAPDVCPKGGGDCDDKVKTTNPGVNENCATIGIDDNCNGNDNDVDADNCTPRFYDNDKDNYGTTEFKCLCKPLGLFFAKLTGDCNDYDKTIHPGAAEICDNIDNNCNGKVNEGCDDDGDGYCDANQPWDVTGILVCKNGKGDCDDQDKEVNPGKAEKCGNGKDDDCDGSQNDPNAIGCTTFYSDADGDGFGTNTSKCLCVPEGTFTATKKGDCDDTKKTVNPIATEMCNNVDDNCNGVKDESCDQDGDGFCDAKKQVTLSDACPKSRPVCAGQEYLNTCYTGFKDTKTFAGANKYCTGLGGHLAVIDESKENEVVRKAALQGCGAGTLSIIGLGDTDKEGTYKWVDGTLYQYKNWKTGQPDNGGAGLDEDGVVISSTTGAWEDIQLTAKHCFVCEVKLANYTPRAGDDCNDNDKNVYPGATEICDDVDSDCDGKVDNSCDKDNDGYCDAKLGVSNPAPKVCPKGGNDCDDLNQDQNPGVKEICGNGIDDDCNGSQNDQDASNCTAFYFDGDKDKYGLNVKLCLCEPAGNYTAKVGGDCEDKNPLINPAGKEICGNSIDDDCSGTQNDENAQGCSKFFLDQDGDKHGLDGLTKCLCFGENDYTAKVGGDCNDVDPKIHKGGTEVCDNADNDCDSKVDEGCNGDGDEYCNGDMVTTGLPSICPKGGGDCNDQDAEVNPGHAEWCDGKDNNCDSPHTSAALAAQRKKWEDAQTARLAADAKVTGLQKDIVNLTKLIGTQEILCQNQPSQQCSDQLAKFKKDKTDREAGLKTAQADAAAKLSAEKTEYNTYIKMLKAGGTSDEGCDDDGDDYCDAAMKTVGKPVACPKGGNDCKDTDKNIHPGMQENCATTFDDNCDGSTNDVNALGCKKFGEDLDGDAYFPDNGKISCICRAEAPLTGTKSGDCDDKNKLVNPGVQEICDGVDNDCDGKVDNGCDDDGDSYCDASMVTIGKPAVCKNGGGDCNDSSASVNPGAKEICNDNIDQNCDGDLNGIDAVGCKKHYHDGDNDGWAVDVALCLCAPQNAYKVTDTKKIGDCDDTTQAVNPAAAEKCGDGLDNNCNGTQNDLNALGCKSFFEDSDKDGYGGGSARCQCLPEGTFVTALGGDCNDNDPTVSPGAPEICDNKDNNCKGGKDEGCDNDLDGFCDANMKIAASATCVNSKKPTGTALVVNNADIKNTGVAGNSGKGTAYTVKCLNGYVAVGLDGLKDNGMVSRYRLKCAKLNPDGSFGITVFSDYFGTANSSPIPAINCAKGHVLIGGTNYVHKATGQLIRFMTRCKSVVDVSKAQNNATASNVGNFGDTASGQSTGTTVCPNGYAVTGIQGTFGPNPYNVGFVCARVENKVDGLVPGDDCNDADKTINPAAVEKCDDKDQDCDGEADNTCDADKDGYCNKTKTIVGTPVVCSKGGNDCDDLNAGVHPGKTEVCDDLDNDCNGQLDDGCDVDGDDYCTQAKSVIGKPKVCPNGAGDCDDKQKAINPGAKEVCDGIDNNCAAGADEICKDNDGDGYCIGNTGVSGGCPKGGNDCDDTNASINPGQREDCNTEADDNCSGTPNDLNAVNCVNWFVDFDGDNWGAGKSECRCHQTGKLTSNQEGDCDDKNPTVNPAATEICDGVNNDCNFKLLKGVQFNGQVVSSMNVGSHGGGFHLFHKEYWYPQWSGSYNTTVRRYDINHKSLGSFNSGRRYVRQLSGDPKEDTYYVACQHNGIRKMKGKTSSVLWTRSISSYPGAVTSDGNKVYAQRYNDYRGLYILNRSNGNQEAYKQLQGDLYGQYNFGLLHAIDGKLYRGAYADRWVYRYNISDLKHDGMKFRVTPTIYTSAFNGKDLCVSDTGNNVYCYELPKSSDPIPGTNARVVGLQPYSHGGGYHLFHKQFWIPEWTSGNTKVRTYNDKYEQTGEFNTGYQYIRQLAGDPNDDHYYTVTYSSSSGISRVRKQKGKTSAVVWSKNPTTYMSGIAVDGKNVYVMRHNSSTVWVLDKTNGNTSKTANLTNGFTGTMYGGLAVVGNKLYRASTDRWLYRYDINLASSSWKHDGGKWQLDVTPYFGAYTGSQLCYGSTSGSIWCYNMPGDVSGLYTGTRNVQPQSHGGGYHPKYKQYWNPGWNGSFSTRIYKYSNTGAYLGNFNSGARYVRAVNGDPTEDTYYMAEQYEGISKRKSNSSSMLWRTNIGSYEGSVDTDGQSVYAMRYNDHRSVYKLDRANGKLLNTLQLDKWYGQDSYGGMHIYQGKLYRGVYSARWVWRYDLATMQHDGIRFQVAPTNYASAITSDGEYCAASTGAPFYCYKLPGKDDNFIGNPAGMDTRSHGAGYHAYFKEYWYPQWSGDTVYRYSQQGKYLGLFRTGQANIMQLVGERTGSAFYTANWGYGTVTKLTGKVGTSKKLWSANIGGTVGGVAVDGNYVYAMRYNSSTLWYLNKETGSTVKTLNLNTVNGNIYGGLAVVQGKLIRGSDNRWVYRYDVSTGQFDGVAFQAGTNIHNSTWDGKEYCIAHASYSAVRWCYPLTNTLQPLSDEGCDDDGDGYCDSSMRITADGTAKVCPKTRMKCDGSVYGGTCVRSYSKTGTTWPQAQAQCETWGGNLASLHGAGQAGAIKTDAVKTCGGIKPFWIGMTDKDFGGSFRWEDGSPVDWTNWAKNEPDSKSTAAYFSDGILLTPSEQATLNDWHSAKVQTSGLSKSANIVTGGQNFNFTFSGIPKPKAGQSTLKVRTRVAGDFGSSSEYANVYIEGSHYGNVGNESGGDCTSKTREFSVPISTISDGVITVRLQNTGSVGAGCSERKVQVELLYEYASGSGQKLLPKWKVCYRASKDGFSSSTFHSKCNGKGPTFTIMTNDKGRKAGGYMTSSWHSSSNYIYDSEAFLFSLSDNKVFDVRYPQYAGYGNNSYGPTFGAGHDIYVNSSMKRGYTYFGHSYKCHLGGSGSTACRNYFFSTYSSWTLSDVEVYYQDGFTTPPPTDGQDYVSVGTDGKWSDVANKTTLDCFVCTRPITGAQYGFGDDCEDGNGAANPGTPEVCDNKDNNCNGAIDEGCDDDDDDYCDASMGVVGTPAACPNGANDCDDADSNVNPGAQENCNTPYDDNCNGLLSENNAKSCIKQYYDGDGDGYGTASFQCLCTTTQCATNTFKDDFDGKTAAGWTFKRCTPNNKNPTNCSTSATGQGWQHRPNSFNYRTPKGALYYGDPKTDKFAFGASAGTARSPKIKVPANAKPELTFSIYSGIEANPKTDHISLRVFVDGKFAEELWGKSKLQSRYLRCDGSAVCNPGSNILTTAQEAQLNSWYGNSNAEWELCYQMSRDGTSASTFHNRCNSKGETMTVIKATNGRKFGGYSNLSWTNGSYYQGTSSSWLYSLDKKTKHTYYRYSQYGIYQWSRYGPTWGGGHDLRSAYSDMRYNGYTNLGHTYRCPSGYGYGNGTCRSWLAGQYSGWQNAEFEVYTRKSNGSTFQTDKWIDLKFDLAKYVGKDIQLEFYFDTVNKDKNDGLGVFIDNIRLANGACSKYTATKYGDCDDTKGYVFPSESAEICDGKDNNCNNVVDEGCDADGDGYCDKDKFVSSTQACPKTGGPGSKNCKIVISDKPRYVGQPISQNTHSHGGGFHPKYQEYFYPSWGSRTIYTYNKQRQNTGSFSTGQYYTMGLAGDPDTKIDQYYTANYYYYRIYAWKGKTSSQAWSVYFGYYAGYVAADDKYVYAQKTNNTRIYVLRKDNGSNIANYYTSGGSYQTYWGYGGSAVLNKVADNGSIIKKYYRAAGSSRFVERFTIPTSGSTAQYDGLRFQTASYTYNATFDGSDLCISPNSSSVYCYTLKESSCTRGDDCNDDTKAQNPGMTELCDDLDNNCDGAVDEKCDKDNDDYCDKNMPVVGAPKTCGKGGGDCDDNDKAKNPGTVEICDGKDNNCNKLIDELGSKNCTNFYFDGDQDGYAVDSKRCLCKADGVFRVPESKFKTLGKDCDDSSATAHPGAKEMCDNLDNDCDKSVDELCDKDGDGYCDKNMITVGAPKVCKFGGNDCNDGNKTVNPGAVELCNNADENCNGIIDENASDHCGYLPNSISKCSKGKCVVVGCAEGYFNLNGLMSDGCECNGTDQHEPNNVCGNATSLSSNLYDHNPNTGAGGTAVHVSGRLVRAPDEDWFKFFARDNTDSGSNACDRFGVRARFLKNPNGRLRFQVYRGKCPPVKNAAIAGPGNGGGENKNNAVCCGDTDFQWFTRFKRYSQNYYSSGESEWGQCPCQSNSSYSTYHAWNSGYNWNGYPGPYCMNFRRSNTGRCIPQGYYKTRCQDDSSWFYLKVYHIGGTASCSDYQFEVTNGIYSGSTRGRAGP